MTLFQYKVLENDDSDAFKSQLKLTFVFFIAFLVTKNDDKNSKHIQVHAYCCPNHTSQLLPVFAHHCNIHEYRTH